ncbi:MAG TPA: hypothetical protein VFM12_02360 [Gemmatimonadales bacterium]|nr:hypothetical protein [Gemmatimonadales bacterium]
MIGPVALGPDSLIAVVDDAPCQVALLKLDGRFLRRIGRCGDGPGDFRRVNALAFRADTLLIWDDARMRLIFMGLDGTEYRALALHDSLPFSYGLVSVSSVDDSTLVVARVTLPVSQDTAANASAALFPLVDARSGAVRSSALQNPPIAMLPTNRDRYEYVATCLQPNHRDPRLAVMGQWAFEGLFLESDSLTTATAFETDLAWHRPARAWGGRQEGFVPGARSSNVVCLDRGALFWALQVDWKAIPPINTGGYMELRSCDGAPLAAQSFTPLDSSFMERPVAAEGRTVVFRSNAVFGYPRLNIFRYDGETGK